MRAQVSFEFIFVIAVVLVVTTLLGTIASTRLTDLKAHQTDLKFKDVTYTVRNEIDIAHSMASGYRRTFELPQYIDGLNYTIELQSGSVFVSYEDRTFSAIVPSVNGSIRKGLNSIANSEGAVILNG
jgi:hypothetical protein